jgi:hypothetical protein
MFEIHGGEDAFINIKYMIPTYESCVLNWSMMKLEEAVGAYLLLLLLQIKIFYDLNNNKIKI